MQLLLASHNRNKKLEMQAILPKHIMVLDLNDLGIQDEIVEDGNSFEENALIKARYLKNLTGMNCIAEDSGLEVFALDLAPGIYSARYAGPQKNDWDNIQLLLKKMDQLSNRQAQFRTVIACLLEHREFIFEGLVRGHISREALGNSGFGYDPIFIPDGYSNSFAQLGNEIKSEISHRSQAVKKLMDFLNITNKNPE